MRRDINHQRFVDGLSRHAGSTAARQNRDVILRRQFDRRLNLIHRARNEYPEGFHLINARVRTVQHAADFIRADFAADGLF